MKFVFELVSKEMRTAVKSDVDCPQPNAIRKVFNVENATDTGHALYFKNKNNECVIYSVEDDGGVGRFRISRDGDSMFVTPNEINLENLTFNIWDDDIGAFHSRQPSITFRVDIESTKGKEIHKQKTRLQTTITSRYYE